VFSFQVRFEHHSIRVPNAVVFLLQGWDTVASFPGSFPLSVRERKEKEPGYEPGYEARDTRVPLYVNREA